MMDILHRIMSVSMQMLAILVLMISLHGDTLQAEAMVFVTDLGNNTIFVADFSSDGLDSLTFDPLPFGGFVVKPVAVDYDPDTRMVYWTQYDTGSIRRANINGTMQSVIVNSNIVRPFYLALDTSRGKVFWTDNSLRRIMSANLDGSSQQFIISTDIQSPCGIIIHKGEGVLFWTDSGTDRIERANLDGGDRHVIVNSGISSPRGLAFNAGCSRVYWCDGGTSKIESVDLWGNDRMVHLATSSMNPWDLAVVDDSIIWTNFDKLGITSTNGSSDYNYYYHSTFGNANGIHVYRDSTTSSIPTEAPSTEEMPTTTEVYNPTTDQANPDDDTSDQDLCDAGWTRNGNACYQLVESTVDYTTALNACRNLNDYGDLVSVADQDESNFLFVYSRRTFDTNYYWIGFNDLDEEGTWAWTDGSVTSYTNWYSGEPSDGSQHCGVLRSSSDGTWNDADCSSTYGYICKYPLNTISCAEWKRKGYTSNGYYTIDPDGRNNGVDPYRVYCDMTTDAGTGITTFEHQEANRSLVTRAEAPFSFIRNIIYGNKSVNQVATGADISGECYQYIKYECHHSIITNYTAWYDRDGNQKNYWGGAMVDSGQCACGISGSCTDGHDCNCDTNDETLREDSGYLTDKTTLPVTEMRFGDTGLSYEYGYYTLGPLYCKGDESFLVTGRTDFMFIKERHLTGYNNAVLSSITVEECATACVSASSFICRSFDYTPSTCYLSEENDLTVDPSSDSPLHLYVRIMDRIEDPFTGPTPSSSLTNSSPPKSTSAGVPSGFIATAVGSAVGAILVIVIVIILIIFYKRRSNESATTKSEWEESNSSPQCENPVFENNVYDPVYHGPETDVPTNQNYPIYEDVNVGGN